MVHFPRTPAPCTVVAELYAGKSDQLLARSRKPAFVIEPPQQVSEMPPLALFEGDREIHDFLRTNGITPVDLPLSGSAPLPARCRLVIVPAGKSTELTHPATRTMLRRFVGGGGTLLLLEPEFDPDGRRGAGYDIALFDDLTLRVEWREDLERGGYDSVVSPGNAAHPVWNGILPEHLQLLNGGFGGIMVPQCDVTPSLPFKAHGRCGLHLKTSALLEVPLGDGGVVISRIQLRGRLLDGGAAPRFFNMKPSLGVPYRSGWWDQPLFDPRPDPVAQRYLLNLLFAFVVDN